jgi:hypothetical protein
MDLTKVWGVTGYILTKLILDRKILKTTNSTAQSSNGIIIHNWTINRQSSTGTSTNNPQLDFN